MASRRHEGSAFGEGLDPGLAGGFAARGPSRAVPRRAAGAHGHTAVAAGRDQRQAHLQGDKRAVRIDAVGLAQQADGLLMPAQPVQHAAHVKRRVDVVLADLFMDLGQHLQRGLQLVLPD